MGRKKEYFYAMMPNVSPACFVAFRIFSRASFSRLVPKMQMSRTCARSSLKFEPGFHAPTIEKKRVEEQYSKWHPRGFWHHNCSRFFANKICTFSNEICTNVYLRRCHLRSNPKGKACLSKSWMGSYRFERAPVTPAFTMCPKIWQASFPNLLKINISCRCFLGDY